MKKLREMSYKAKIVEAQVFTESIKTCKMLIIVKLGVFDNYYIKKPVLQKYRLIKTFKTFRT